MCRLMWSNFPSIIELKQWVKTSVLCYCSVNIITFVVWSKLIKIILWILIFIFSIYFPKYEGIQKLPFKIYSSFSPISNDFCIHLWKLSTVHKVLFYPPLRLQQGFQTRIDRRNIFQRKKAPRAAVYWEVHVGHKLLEKLWKGLKLDQNLKYYQFLNVHLDRRKLCFSSIWVFKPCFNHRSQSDQTFFLIKQRFIPFFATKLGHFKAMPILSYSKNTQA
jgi:hypothetical protein